MNINYQHSNWHNKWWVNISCSFKITHAANLLLQKIKLCSFTNNLISQKFSDKVVMLAIAVSKHCTQDLPVVNTQGSSTGFLFTYHSAIPVEWLYTTINPHRWFIKHYINNLQEIYNILKIIDTILNKLFYKCSKRNDKEVYIVTHFAVSFGATIYNVLSFCFWSASTCLLLLSSPFSLLLITNSSSRRA